MAACCFWIFASFILLFLGTIHLYYTLFSNKFSIRDAAVEQGMKNAFPVLTGRTTVWKAWIGFNASHSLCGIYIGLINMYLALASYDILKESLFIKYLTLCSALFLLYLGKKYWFNIPFTGILVSCVCYAIALFLM